MASRTATTASSTTRANPDRKRGTGPASTHWSPAGMAGGIIPGAGPPAPRSRRAAGRGMGRRSVSGAGTGGAPAGLGVRRDCDFVVAVWSGWLRAILTVPMIATSTTAGPRSVDTSDPISSKGYRTDWSMPAPPAPRPLRPWMVVLAVLSLLTSMVAVAARFVSLPYDSIGPGSARAVNSVVTVTGHPSYPPRGQLLYTTVAVRERVN